MADKYLNLAGATYLIGKVKTLLGGKVDKVDGKGLSTNDYTTDEKTKLSGIAAGANKTTVDSAMSSTSTNPVQNKVVNAELEKKSNVDHVHDLSTMVNTLEVSTDTPSDEDYYVSQAAGGGATTTTYYRRPLKALLEYIKGKLATVAVSGSYNDLSNKPTIPTVGNGTVTIKQAGATKGSFSMNQAGNVEIDLTDNNTTYSEFVKSGTGAKAGLVPAPSTTAGTSKYLREDGTWVTPPNSTYAAMKGASASAAGTAGLVPAPAAGAQAKFLQGDGTWAIPKDTTYSDASQSAHGLMTAEDKKKLDGIADGATKVTVDSSLSSTSTNPVQNKVVQAELEKKAPLASPTFTGTPKVPTAEAGNNTTQAASTAFVVAAITAAISGITGIEFQIVSKLPTTGTKGVFYLIANSGSGQNVYDEYIWVNGKFEKLGTRELDLSGYMKTSDMVAITTAEIDAAFA